LDLKHFRTTKSWQTPKWKIFLGCKFLCRCSLQKSLIHWCTNKFLLLFRIFVRYRSGFSRYQASQMKIFKKLKKVLLSRRIDFCWTERSVLREVYYFDIKARLGGGDKPPMNSLQGVKNNYTRSSHVQAKDEISSNAKFHLHGIPFGFVVRRAICYNLREWRESDCAFRRFDRVHRNGS